MKVQKSSRAGAQRGTCLYTNPISSTSFFAAFLAIIAAILVLPVNNVGATQVLANRAFESGANGWIGYSPVTWGNYGVNSDYNCTANGSSAFWVRGAWNWPQPNWMGAYQNLVSAPGCGYQATGSILSPAGYGTRGDTSVGDFGWIGIDDIQNYAWIEVSFRDSAGTIIALYKSAVFNSTSPQSTWVESPVTNACDIGNNYAVTGSVSTLIAPPGTAIVRFQTVFEQANWGHGAVWFDELSLNQVSGPVPPSIANLSPDGSRLFNPVNNFTFTVSSSTTDINTSGIHVAANGLDVTSQLAIAGTARDRNVSLTLKSNQVYAISITVTDAVNFTSSANVLFDTFQPNYYMVECEDYDFNGGQFIDNPVLSSTPQAGSYFDKAGLEGIDYLETDGAGDHLYRTGDRLATTYAGGDLSRDKFVQAQGADPAIADYKVGWFNGGEWVNYTRTYPSGKFNVYLRAAGGAGAATVDLSRVTAGQGTSDQTTALLGSFNFTGRGWATYDWVPLADTYGNLIAVDLASTATLRVTTHGGADINFLMLVPAKLDRPVIANFYPDGTMLFQPTNQFVFSVSSPQTTIPAANILLKLNGVDVSSQLAIAGTSTAKSAVFSGLKTNTAYTAAITVTDLNGNVSTVTVLFDTFIPIALWEGEDWDFNSGQFINDPVLSSAPAGNSYFGRVGVQDIDENETANNGTGDGPPGDHAFRPDDVMAAGTANEVARQNFSDAQATDPNIKDYATGWFDSGEWVNYTRVFPAGTYNVFARLSNGNGGSANAYLDKVTSGQGTANQRTARLGTFTFQGRGWSSYDYVPLRDRFGNVATLSLDGQTTLRLTSGPLGGGVNANFLFLVPARTDLLSISGVYPDGATLLQGTNKFAFTAANPTYAIDPNGIKVTLNGADVSSQLQLSGTPNNRTVSLDLVPNFANYTAVIQVTDANTNVATTTVYFDTFGSSSFTWEAEDYDFNSGLFIDNPTIGAYYGLGGVNGTDYYMDLANPPNNATYLYRTADLIATEVCSDTLLPKYALALAADPTVKNYDVGWWLAGQWMNFTRTYPFGDFFIYGRLSGNGVFHVSCDKVVDGTTTPLGAFTRSARGWALYDWVPLTDVNGERAVVSLDGVTTLRLTSDGNANANSFMLVPSIPPPAPVQLQATPSQGNVLLTFPTVVGSNYRIYYKNDLNDSGWALLTMVAGDGAVKSVSDPIIGSSRFYRLLIQ